MAAWAVVTVRARYSLIDLSQIWSEKDWNWTTRRREVSASMHATDETKKLDRKHTKDEAI